MYIRKGKNSFQRFHIFSNRFGDLSNVEVLIGFPTVTLHTLIQGLKSSKLKVRLKNTEHVINGNDFILIT